MKIRQSSVSISGKSSLSLFQDMYVLPIYMRYAYNNKDSN